MYGQVTESCWVLVLVFHPDKTSDDGETASDKHSDDSESDSDNQVLSFRVRVVVVYPQHVPVTM